MLLFILLALIVTPKCLVVAADDVMIPYLDEDALGININDLDEDDEDMLPPCDLTNPDPKLVEWRLLSNSHQVFLDLDNGPLKADVAKPSLEFTRTSPFFLQLKLRNN